MRKVQHIRVADKRRVTSIKDFIRSSPSQTLSSTPPEATDGLPQPPCSGSTPITRSPCAEWSYLFGGVDLPAGWGGDWEPNIYWTEEDIIAEVSPFNSPSQEWLEVVSDWPMSADGVYTFGMGGYLENGYAAEIWNESPFNSGNVTTLNSKVWYGGAVVNRSLHNYVDSSNNYFPFGVKFDLTVHEIMETAPSVGSGSRASTLLIGLERLKWPIVYDPPFGDHTEAEVEHYHSIPLASTGLEIQLNSPFFTPPASGPKMFGVKRNAATDTIQYNWQAGHRYSVVVCVGELLTQAKVWDTNLEEEPSDWQVVAGPSTLSNYVPGISAKLSELDFQAGDTESGSKVSFHFVRANPIDNPCVFSSGGHPIYPCSDDDMETGPGYYFDTLVPKNGYWIPVTQDVSYYKQIYFDGMPVSEDLHYWLDGLRVHPNDPTIFASTIATAEVVVR